MYVRNYNVHISYPIGWNLVGPIRVSILIFRHFDTYLCPEDMPGNAVEVFNILISYLLHEHIDYALEIGLQGIPLPGKYFNIVIICLC